MNVLWISHLLPYPPKGGVLIRSYNNLKELAKYHSVYFIGLYQRAHQPNQESLTEAIKQMKRICDSVTVHPFESFQGRFSWYLLALTSLFSFASYKEAWCKSTMMVESIKRIIREVSVDLVHFDTISLLQYYDHIPTEIPIAINHHNIESHMMFRRCKKEKNWFLKVYFYLEALKIRRLEKKYCGKGINLVVSYLDQKRLREIVPWSRISVIPNGVDLNYFQKLRVPEMKNSIVFVGGLKWYPNVDAMRFFCKEVWPKLIKRVGNIQFLIIGRNPPNDLVEYSKRDPRIQFKGFVKDIRPILSAATCYVCPMREGGGTRLKVLDALAMGVPLVATKMACEGINLKDNESALLAETPDEFVDKILMLFNDSDLRKKVREHSRQLVQREYDYEKIGIKLKKCYESELDSQRRADA